MTKWAYVMEFSNKWLLR